MSYKFNPLIFLGLDIAGSGGSGSGANTSLSNLTSPTAINKDLIFDEGATATIQTKDASAATENLIIQTGDSSGDASGNLTLATGSASGTRGFIEFDALVAVLPTGTIDPSNTYPDGSCYYNTSTNTIQILNGGFWRGNQSNGTILFDDFTEANTSEDVFGRYKSVTTASGTVTKAVPDADLPQYPGVIHLEIDTTADSAAHLHFSGSTPDQRNFVFGNGNILVNEWMVKITQVDGDGIWTGATAAVGFSDSFDAYGGSHIAVFFLEPNQEFWGMWTYGGAGPDIYTYSTDVPLTVGWHKLRIEGNAAGTEVVYSVDDVIVATHTTGIPNNPLTDSMGTACTIFGTGIATTFDVDYSKIELTLGTPR